MMFNFNRKAKEESLIEQDKHDKTELQDKENRKRILSQKLNEKLNDSRRQIYELIEHIKPSSNKKREEGDEGNN